MLFKFKDCFKAGNSVEFDFRNCLSLSKNWFKLLLANLLMAFCIQVIRNQLILDKKNSEVACLFVLFMQHHKQRCFGDMCKYKYAKVLLK